MLTCGGVRTPNPARLVHESCAAGDAGDEAEKTRLLLSFLFIIQMQQGRCYQSAFSYWRRLQANPEALTMGER